VSKHANHQGRPARRLCGLHVGAVSALALLTVAAWSPTSVGAASSATWAHYFFPTKVGWTCHETIASSGITGTEDETVTAVGKVIGGTSVTVTEGSSTTVNGTTVPTNAVLHYILSNNGQLISTPSSGQAIGQVFHLEGDTTFPSVAKMLGGGTGASTVHGTEPLSQATLSQISSVLKPHATSLVVTMVLKQSGHSVPELETKYGTFHNVLWVRSTLTSIKVDNALPAAAKELDSGLKTELAKIESNAVWYAPGEGPVQIELDGIMGYMTSCGAS
jgi:hypothetical protein